MNPHRVFVLAPFLAAAVFLGTFFLAKFFNLPYLVILGWTLVIVSLFSLRRAFWGPLAKIPAARNVRIVHTLSGGLFAAAMFLAAWKKTSYAVVLLGAAVIVPFVIGRRYMRKLRDHVSEQKAKEQPKS